MLARFLRELRERNDRDWFKANKGPLRGGRPGARLQFVAEFAPHLATISPHMAANLRPVGGSVFRIYRDTRFSRDKSPYKTHRGIHFRHEEARTPHSPVFCLQLEPGTVFAAVATLSERAACAPGFLEEFAATSRAFAPYLRFLCDALELPF